MENKATTKPFYNTTIPSDWEVMALGDLTQLISGLHLNPDEYNNTNEGIPYFTGPTDYTDELTHVTKYTT